MRTFAHIINNALLDYDSFLPDNEKERDCHAGGSSAQRTRNQGTLLALW